MTTLYEIFQTQGRPGVEAAASKMFGADATGKLLTFALVGKHNAWADDIIATLSEEQKSSLSQHALEMACYATNDPMIEKILSWGYTKSEDLEHYVLFLLNNDGGSIAGLKTLFASLATPTSDLGKALVFACRFEFYPHHQEMIEGICKYANPLDNEKLPLWWAIQSKNPALLPGMMPRLLTTPNAQQAKNEILSLHLNDDVRAYFLKTWSDAEQSAPIWDKNRLQEELKDLTPTPTKKRAL